MERKIIIKTAEASDTRLWEEVTRVAQDGAYAVLLTLVVIWVVVRKRLEQVVDSHILMMTKLTNATDANTRLLASNATAIADIEKNLLVRDKVLDCVIDNIDNNRESMLEVKHYLRELHDKEVD